MTVAAITSEIQKLAPSSVIELFVLDLALFGQGPVRFHAGTNALQQRVVWQGNAYEAFPIEVEGFEFNGNGQVPRPRLRVANVTGAITALVLTYQDLVGAKITRKRTLAKYLDAVNFEGGVNPLMTCTTSTASPEKRGMWSSLSWPHRLIWRGSHSLVGRSFKTCAPGATVGQSAVTPVRST